MAVADVPSALLRGLWFTAFTRPRLKYERQQQQSFPSLTERIINVSETATKVALFERSEFATSGRTLQLINERSSSLGSFFGSFL